MQVVPVSFRCGRPGKTTGSVPPEGEDHRRAPDGRSLDPFDRGSGCRDTWRTLAGPAGAPPRPRGGRVRPLFRGVLVWSFARPLRGPHYIAHRVQRLPRPRPRRGGPRCCYRGQGGFVSRSQPVRLAGSRVERVARPPVGHAGLRADVGTAADTKIQQRRISKARFYTSTTSGVGADAACSGCCGASSPRIVRRVG